MGLYLFNCLLKCVKLHQTQGAQKTLKGKDIHGWTDLLSWRWYLFNLNKQYATYKTTFN
jgi:hypothetical protein